MDTPSDGRSAEPGPRRVGWFDSEPRGQGLAAAGGPRRGGARRSLATGPTSSASGIGFAALDTQ